MKQSVRNRTLDNGKHEYGVRMQEDGTLPVCGDCGGWHARCLETGRAVSIVWRASQRGEIETVDGLPCLVDVTESEATGEYSYVSDFSDSELRYDARIVLEARIRFTHWVCPTDLEVRRRRIHNQDVLDALTEGRLSRTELVAWAVKGREYCNSLDNIDEDTDDSLVGEDDEDLDEEKHEWAVALSDDGGSILCEECGGTHVRCINTGTRISIMPAIDDNEKKRMCWHLPCLAKIGQPPPEEKYAYVDELPNDDLRETVRSLMDDAISCENYYSRDREVHRCGVLCEDTLDALNTGQLTRLELVMWAKEGYEYLDMLAEL